MHRRVEQETCSDLHVNAYCLAGLDLERAPAWPPPRTRIFVSNDVDTFFHGLRIA